MTTEVLVMAGSTRINDPHSTRRIYPRVTSNPSEQYWTHDNPNPGWLFNTDFMGFAAIGIVGVGNLSAFSVLQEAPDILLSTDKSDARADIQLDMITVATGSASEGIIQSRLDESYESWEKLFDFAVAGCGVYVGIR